MYGGISGSMEQTDEITHEKSEYVNLIKGVVYRFWAVVDEDGNGKNEALVTPNGIEIYILCNYFVYFRFKYVVLSCIKLTSSVMQVKKPLHSDLFGLIFVQLISINTQFSLNVKNVMYQNSTTD